MNRRYRDREQAIAEGIAARLGPYVDDYDLEGIAEELVVESPDGDIELTALTDKDFFVHAGAYARDALPGGGCRP